MNTKHLDFGRSNDQNCYQNCILDDFLKELIEKYITPGLIEESENEAKAQNKYKVDAQKFSPKKKQIRELKEQLETNNEKIEKMKVDVKMLNKKIEELETNNREINTKLVILSKKEPLEDFFNKVQETEKTYEINLSNTKEQFEKLFNKLKKDENLHLSIDKTNDGFALMVEGVGFSSEQKTLIAKLKKLFKSLNI